jgi:hypothetical protein
MKIFFALCTAFALLAAVPAPAKEAKKTKREEKEEKAKKEQEAKAAEDAKKEILYSAVIKPLKGDATDSDVARVKGLLSVATMFKMKDVGLVEKDIVATIYINTGRLSKSDVAKMLKDGKETKYRLDRLVDIKPEKEKKDGDKEKETGKPGDKKEEMKKDETKDSKDAPKEAPKPGTPAPAPAPAPAAETPPPAAK